MTKFTGIGVAALAAALLGATVEAQASPYIVTLEEVGSDVVATGSGQLDISGLGFYGGIAGYGPGYVSPLYGRILTGAGGTVDIYLPAWSGPSAFGPASFSSSANSGSGDTVGAYAGILSYLLVPHGYASDSALADSSTYLGATLVSLGVTPGTYVWTWGLGADQSFTLEIGPTPLQTPLPAALPLFASGLGALGLLGWRRKRKMQAAA
jgi:hypothetical protein